MQFNLTQNTSIYVDNNPKLTRHGISIHENKSFDGCDEFGNADHLQYKTMKFAFMDSETKEAWKGDIEIATDGTELAVVRSIE